MPIKKTSAVLSSAIGQGTEKLYYTDAYMNEFDATVVQCTELPEKTDNGLSRYAVILDQTAFFPEEGGQSPDKGQLLSDVAAQVLDVQVRQGIITHITDRPFDPGSQVHGILDFHHRFSNMQQHSAEHLYSGLVYKHLGLDNVGFHLSDHEVTMDYSGPITEEKAAELELEVNRLIWKNIESRQEFPTAEELESISYRSKTAIEGQVRLVVFPGCDTCACCAPHVARTGEIGLFKILSVQSHRGGVRIRMLAGERVFKYLAREHDLLTEASRSLSTSPDQLKDRIEKLRSDMFSTRHALSETEQALLDQKIAAIPASQENVCLFTQGLEERAMREAVNRLMAEHTGVCGVFNGSDSAGYRYVLGSASDVASMQQLLRNQLQARGGGKPPMIQGQVQASHSEIAALFAHTVNT